MKKYIKYLFVFLAITACNNDDNKKTPNPIDQLPPITTSGKNTIGCLVNGVPFTDSGLMNNFYQFVNGEYYLVINWENGFGDNFVAGQISIRKTQIVEGESYILNNNNSSSEEFSGGSAKYVFSDNSNSGEFNTNSNYYGTVTFTRFDTENQIMAGTFEFQAQELITGEIVNITEGRFDLTFIQ
ncbi:hypothetical protein [Flavobacterium sp.]|uniref:hypothetical protein n=1 Tax=Flavobacterium sp. TaxID=239 RepID=UPI002601C4B0|nr:hypothetical protein [Flavobacterium sp.]MDD3003652.1 hypothetical protein [Flavobacterium sp.]